MSNQRDTNGRVSGVLVGRIVVVLLGIGLCLVGVVLGTAVADGAVGTQTQQYLAHRTIVAGTIAVLFGGALVYTGVKRSFWTN